MNFELLVWGDGTPRLYHEDHLHGEDIVIALEEGEAYLCHYDAEGESHREKVNLAEFLRELALARET